VSRCLVQRRKGSNETKKDLTEVGDVANQVRGIKRGKPEEAMQACEIRGTVYCGGRYSRKRKKRAMSSILGSKRDRCPAHANRR